MPGSLRLQEKSHIIDQVPLFSDLSRRDKAFIADSIQIVEFGRGEAIYNEGDAPDAFYCIVTGRVRISIASHGAKKDLEYLKRGRYFGILSLLTGEPHSVSAVAVNDSIILKIPKKNFEKILRQIPRLAIHFGETISRRLKRKDIDEKRIFECSIISVFGTSDKIGVTSYAVNLAVALAVQTNKKVILLDINKEGDLALDSPFFDEKTVKGYTSRYADRVDVLKLTPVKGLSGIISLLSYLTSDYHYVIFDLPPRTGRFVLDLLKQSDTLHLLTASDSQSLELASGLVSELTGSSNELARKIKVITTEYGGMAPVDFGARSDLLKSDIYAALPDITRTDYMAVSSKGPIVLTYPDCEYSKAVRRIARETGGCLIGLALGAGAAMGLAHIGILKILEEERIPVDVLAGTSIGALLGAFWASGKKPVEIADIFFGFNSKMKTMRLIDLAIPKRGLIKGREIKRFLRRHLGGLTFRDLRLPFRIITCDIQTREEVVIGKGDLVDAIMASISIPGMFEPVTIEGRQLVDGGIINPTPVNVLVRMGVEKIISVNTLPSPEDIQKSRKKAANIFDIMVNSMQASEYLLAEMSCQEADIAMHPILQTADWYEFYKAPDLIARGEEEAMRYLPQLKELVTL